ncbi:MAG: nickel pincer cofactor biosynthesis protein LarB [Fuerstiella sp.]
MLTDPNAIRRVIAEYLTDPAQVEQAVTALTRGTATGSVNGALVDLGRSARCGFPEVIFGEGKPAELIVDIFRRQQAAGQPGFATRISPEQATAVAAALPEAVYHPLARTLTLQTPASDRSDAAEIATQVAVVSAGSCDASVAHEAFETLRWMQVPVTLIDDVGVAGPQRLLQHVSILQQMKAIVCVAGMEAALPSVVGGHVSCPVIGVPTSVGYGASFGGIAALLSMLNCCASNVVTVNIDAGFRGGYVAGVIARGCEQPAVA